MSLAINKIFNDSYDYQTMKCNPVYMYNSAYPYYGLIYEIESLLSEWVRSEIFL